MKDTPVPNDTLPIVAMDQCDFPPHKIPRPYILSDSTSESSFPLSS